MSRYTASLAAGVALVVILAGARVFEVAQGGTPSEALTAAFSASVAGVLALMAVGQRNGK